MAGDPPSPSVPPVATADLPGAGGTIGPLPEDFQVDEIPLYAASGEGEHLYVRVQKRELNTRDAVRLIAAAAGVPEPEIGTAGMKDKHAVTTQWMSLPARRARPVSEWVLPEGLRITESSRHGNKLRTGHLAGNRFRIRIVGVGPEALENAGRVLARLREHGLPNYFGAQRFGRGGSNLERALAWLGAESRGERPRVPGFERKLYASVVQSEVFNRYVTSRIAEGLGRPLIGEVVRLNGTGSLFVVEDEAREAPRWATRDIHPTGPMIGPKAKAARGRPLELERAAADGLGLGPEVLSALARFADGTRRDVLVWLDDVVVEPDAEGPGALWVTFSLPSGSYATELIRELTREPFFRYGA
jgi:tRNA pseudouridine13 synthase